jgi:hypothetical protein
VLHDMVRPYGRPTMLSADGETGEDGSAGAAGSVVDCPIRVNVSRVVHGASGVRRCLSVASTSKSWGVPMSKRNHSPVRRCFGVSSGGHHQEPSKSFRRKGFDQAPVTPSSCGLHHVSNLWQSRFHVLLRTVELTAAQGPELASLECAVNRTIS